MSDTVFSIDKNGVLPFLAIKSKNLVSPVDVEKIKQQASHSDEQYDILKSNKEKLFSIHNYLKFNDIIYFQYWQGKQSYRVFFHPVANDIGVTHYLRNDILYKHGNESVTFFFANANGVYEYVETHPDTMSKLMESIKQNELLISGKLPVTALAEGSNPIIFYYTN